MKYTLLLTLSLLFTFPLEHFAAPAESNVLLVKKKKKKKGGWFKKKKCKCPKVR
jgi:hypothetical protein